MFVLGPRYEGVRRPWEGRIKNWTEWSVGQRVTIIPIAEEGVIVKVRKDERGEPLIDVRRDGDGVFHVCRVEELKIGPREA